MKYFVSSDIHGFHSEWIEALKEKQFNINNPEHIIIVCGDLFDRGPQAIKLQNFVVDLIDANKIILIKGNHEDLFLDMLNSWHKKSYLELHHNSNGTVDTVVQLADCKPSDVYNNPIDVYHKIKQTPFLNKILPAMLDYFETKNYVFVHGYIPAIRDKYPGGMSVYTPIKEWRNASDLSWAKARWYNGMDAASQGVVEPNKTIVCGHWHCSYGHANIEGKGSEFGENADFTPYYGKGVIAIDACTVASKKVNVLVIED